MMCFSNFTSGDLWNSLFMLADWNKDKDLLERKAKICVDTDVTIQSQVQCYGKFNIDVVHSVYLARDTYMTSRA